ncbi:FtsW/RodA/SpoVE family cell cycle protein [bacterium]|nr:FtsW/RodA/SpoVE family cell cycle protein [bacterium]
MEKAVRIYFSIFFLLVAFGMVMVFNVKMFNVSSAEAALLPQIRGLVINFAFAGAAFITAYLVNISWLKNSSRYLVLIIILLLTATLIIGTTRNGAKRWIDLHFMMLQPSEFAKIVVVIYLSEVMTKKGERVQLLKDLFSIGLVVIAIVGLIAKEDLGTATIICGTAMLMLLLGGMRKKYLLYLAPLAVAAFCLLVFMPGKDYRVGRLQSFIDPCGKEFRANTGLQQCRAQVALSIGGTTGVGFGNSTVKIKDLPESQTDFIFPIIGEEFGFVGSVVMIMLFMAMFGIGTYFVMRLRDTFNFYMVAGFVLMLAIQVVIHLFVVSSLSPNKGVPLPFISYGGSALASYSFMVGLILNAVTSESRR